MFGRQVTMRLKLNSATELTRINTNQIIPILIKHKGFRDETFFIAPDRSEAVANTFWDTKEDAEAFNRTGYPEVLRALTTVIDGTPLVKTFELANSTFHMAAAKAA